MIAPKGQDTVFSGGSGMDSSLTRDRLSTARTASRASSGRAVKGWTSKRRIASFFEEGTARSVT